MKVVSYNPIDWVKGIAAVIAMFWILYRPLPEDRRKR